MQSYLTTKELAEILHIKPNTLERQRTNRECPIPWTKFNGRVLYSKADVQAYLESQSRNQINANIK